jgi:hypothetical protein
VYYIHCEPKRCLVAGGLWHPEKQYVDLLRRSIDRHPDRWRRALNNPLFKKVFLPGVKAKAGPEAAVKAFVGMNQANALKKRPMVKNDAFLLFRGKQPFSLVMMMMMMLIKP